MVLTSIKTVVFYSKSKSTWGEQSVEDIPIFTCKFVGLSICTEAPGQTENDTALKFGTYTPLDHIQNRFFVFLKVTPRAASLEELPCQLNFPQISSITLFNTYIKCCRGFTIVVIWTYDRLVNK